MTKLSMTAAALALAFAGNAALADDSSMSRWSGDSYAAFQSANGYGAAAGLRRLAPADDNSLSRWHGDSHAAFERERTSPAPVTISIAEANKARAAANRVPPPRNATRERTPVNPFRDDTSA